jgi:DNA-binding NtrC family response regulator
MPLPSLSRCRLLLVEDDTMVRDTIMLMLEDDYEILLAVSVRTAMARLRAPEAGRIDLVLLDCLLPDGNVTDVLAAADQQSIPVVLISGDPRQAEARGPGRVFLPKPFTQATLLKVLDTARG